MMSFGLLVLILLGQYRIYLGFFLLTLKIYRTWFTLKKYLYKTVYYLLILINWYKVNKNSVKQQIKILRVVYNNNYF